VRTVLLGPQRFLTTAGTVVRSVAPEGPVVTVTAGWQDREAADGELDEVMDGRSRNLRLYERLTDVLETDDRFAGRALAHRDAMDELAGIYSLRLQRALESVYVVARRPARHDIADAAFADAVRGLRDIDDWYLRTVDQLYAELEGAAPPESSEPIARHRHEVAELLRDAAVVAVAGGHVGILLRCLRLFAVVPARELPVVAWSAGAMALTERVLLFHDRAAYGPTHAEFADVGPGWISAAVLLPHARRRLRIDDTARMAELAVRAVPARCVILDDGARLDLGPDGALPPDALVVGADGRLGLLGGAA